MVLAPSETDVLIVVDVQNDFLPRGALAVPDGDAIVPLVNQLVTRFAHIILTQDWHPAGHRSFASSHPGKVPFDTVMTAHGTQVLWPDHCVQGTLGAEHSSALAIAQAELVIRKGFRRHIDSYSAFREADRATPTGLAGYLRERGLSRVFLAGLATDFCVASSAVDARDAGFEAVVVEDACRAIDTGGSHAAAWTRMQEAGVVRVRARDLGL
jgi:nicotinamidase/pyrazinamidase